MTENIPEQLKAFPKVKFGKEREKERKKAEVQRLSHYVTDANDYCRLSLRTTVQCVVIGLLALVAALCSIIKMCPSTH